MAAGLDCGSGAKQSQQLVAAHLAACSAAAASQQQAEQGDAFLQQEPEPVAAHASSFPQPRDPQQTGRSKRRAALAAQAAFAAVGGDDDDSSLLLQDQENVLQVLQSPQAAKIYGGAAPSLDAKQALQPQGQPLSSTKRHRH